MLAMRTLVTVSLLLGLAGCKSVDTTPVSQVNIKKNDEPPADFAAMLKASNEAQKRVDINVEILEKRIKLQQKVSAAKHDADAFIQDCLRQMPEEWESNHCADRKKSLQARLAKLQRESDALDASTENVQESQ